MCGWWAALPPPPRLIDRDAGSFRPDDHEVRARVARACRRNDLRTNAAGIAERDGEPGARAHRRACQGVVGGGAMTRASSRMETEVPLRSDSIRRRTPPS